MSIEGINCVNKIGGTFHPEVSVPDFRGDINIYSFCGKVGKILGKSLGATELKKTFKNIKIK